MKPDAGKPLPSRLIHAFGYALRGVAAASRDRMFRLQLLAGAAAIGMATWLHLSPIEWTVLMLTITIVLAFEVMNTAVETVVDLVSPDMHPLAGRAKDLAAGAVLLICGGATAVGFILFEPKLWRLFSI